jgi:hypothetical protein
MAIQPPVEGHRRHCRVIHDEPRVVGMRRPERSNDEGRIYPRLSVDIGHPLDPSGEAMPN